MKRPANMGRFALRVFLVLVGLNAAIGIVALIAGGLGRTGGRILLTTVLLAMIVTATWGEVSSSWFGRIFGAFAVALTAFLLVIPVLARAGARDAPASRGTTATRVAFCPNCGRPIAMAFGQDTRCGACGATFEVRFQDPGRPRPTDTPTL